MAAEAQPAIGQSSQLCSHSINGNGQSAFPNDFVSADPIIWT
jgi:hypothetical protein